MNEIIKRLLLKREELEKTPMSKSFKEIFLSGFDEAFNIVRNVIVEEIEEESVDIFTDKLEAGFEGK